MTKKSAHNGAHNGAEVPAASTRTEMTWFSMRLYDADGQRISARLCASEPSRNAHSEKNPRTDSRTTEGGERWMSDC